MARIEVCPSIPHCQRAEKKLYLDKMVNQGGHTTKETEADDLTSSEMLSMLKFGAQCCFSSAEPPSDAQLDRIIDRSRKEGDAIGEGFGGKQHTAADFDATAPMLNTRELQAHPQPTTHPPPWPRPDPTDPTWPEPAHHA